MEGIVRGPNTHFKDFGACPPPKLFRHDRYNAKKTLRSPCQTLVLLAQVKQTHTSHLMMALTR